MQGYSRNIFIDPSSAPRLSVKQTVGFPRVMMQKSLSPRSPWARCLGI